MEEKQEEIILALKDLMNENRVGFASKFDNVYDKNKTFYELDEYGELTDKAKAKIVKEIESYIGDGASDLANAIEVWYYDALNKGTITWYENIVTEYKEKTNSALDDLHEVDVGKITRDEHDKANTNLETYSVSRKGLIHESREALRESERDSAQEITDRLAEVDLESENGKIALRTQKLFTELSKKGFSSRVSFDNGESTNKIDIDDPEVGLVVTISNSKDKLALFVSGNFELTDKNIEQLAEVKKIVDGVLAE